MKIACLSGKGGAGKTFTAVNLAYTASNSCYIDCDVEEPNGRIFFNSEGIKMRNAVKLLPTFDSDKCIGCRKCMEFCHFHAIMFIKNKPRLFDEVCHSCGGCSIVCPTGAITEQEKTIGTIEIGYHNNIKVVTGIMNTGETSGVPVISEALKEAYEGEESFTIIDCPPGSACTVTESIKDADYCVITAEPTAFGFHNFCMVHELVTLLNKKCGVIINKEQERYEPLEEYCRKHELPVLAKIPYDPDIALLISDGKAAVSYNKKLEEIFKNILNTIGGVL